MQVHTHSCQTQVLQLLKAVNFVVAVVVVVNVIVVALLVVIGQIIFSCGQ